MIKTFLRKYVDFVNEGKTNEGKTSGFNRVLTMSSTWWSLWKAENEKDFEIKQDALTKTFEVYKDKKLIFVYDYGRSKIFTNETPTYFELKRVSPKAKEEAEKKDPETGKEEVKDAPPTEKGAEAAGELETDQTEEE